MAGLRAGLPRFRAEAARLSARRVLGGPRRRRAHRAQPAEDQGGARQCGSSSRSPASTAASAASSAQWPADDQIGLLELLAKRGARLGGRTGQYFLRFIGKDGFVTSPDVVACLREAGVDIAESPTSKKDMRKVQDQLNAWARESGLPLTHIPHLPHLRHVRRPELRRGDLDAPRRRHGRGVGGLGARSPRNCASGPELPGCNAPAPQIPSFRQSLGKVQP